MTGERRRSDWTSLAGGGAGSAASSVSFFRQEAALASRVFNKMVRPHAWRWLVGALAVVLLVPTWLGAAAGNAGNVYLLRALAQTRLPGEPSFWQRGVLPTCPDRAVCEAGRDWLTRAHMWRRDGATLTYHLGLAHALAGNLSAAERVWASAQGNELGARLSAFWLGLRLAARGDHEAAREWWRRGDVGPWLLALARRQALRGEVPEALALLDDASAVWPATADVGEVVEGYRLAGRVATRSQAWDEAITAYRKALALFPADADTRLRLADAHRRAGNFLQAEQEARRAVKEGNVDQQVQAYEFLGLLYEEAGRLQEAEQAYRQAIASLGPGLPSFRLADLLRRQGRLAEAEEALLRAAGSGGNSPQLRARAWQELAGLYEQEERWEEAERAYREALAVAPEPNVYRIQLARLLGRRGRDEEAEALLQDVARSADADWRGEALSTLGDLYAARGQWSEALAAYRAAAETVPTNAEYWRRLARLYEQLGLYDEAQKLYERLPDEP